MTSERGPPAPPGRFQTHGQTEERKSMTEHTIARSLDKALGIMRGLAKESGCVVSHPDASEAGQCGEPAIGTVWNLCFCEVHFAEAEASAHDEILADAGRQLELLADMETGSASINPALVRLLEQGAASTIVDARRRRDHDHHEALREA